MWLELTIRWSRMGTNINAWCSAREYGVVMCRCAWLVHCGLPCIMTPSATVTSSLESGTCMHGTLNPVLTKNKWTFNFKIDSAIVARAATASLIIIRWSHQRSWFPSQQLLHSAIHSVHEVYQRFRNLHPRIRSMSQARYCCAWPPDQSDSWWPRILPMLILEAFHFCWRCVFAMYMSAASSEYICLGYPHDMQPVDTNNREVEWRSGTRKTAEVRYDTPATFSSESSLKSYNPYWSWVCMWVVCFPSCKSKTKSENEPECSLNYLMLHSCYSVTNTWEALHTVCQSLRFHESQVRQPSFVGKVRCPFHGNAPYIYSRVYEHEYKPSRRCSTVSTLHFLTPMRLCSHSIPAGSNNFITSCTCMPHTLKWEGRKVALAVWCGTLKSKNMVFLQSACKWFTEFLEGCAAMGYNWSWASYWHMPWMQWRRGQEDQRSQIDPRWDQPKQQRVIWCCTTTFKRQLLFYL